MGRIEPTKEWSQSIQDSYTALPAIDKPLAKFISMLFGIDVV